MIDTAKFSSELSHHDNSWSFHLRKLSDDRGHACDFIDADFFVMEVFLLHFEMSSFHKR